MKPEGINFPVYRKYKNGRSYFKILNEQQFEELRIVGQRHLQNLVNAEHLPEKYFIQDLLHNFRDMAVEITAEEYERKKASGKTDPQSS